ncbi:helix-turn-helix domain-containing protein [Kitasatospora aureofaciens]|uniref:helix-turn-helix domain-containing protein n=1 Tax=Kitasatospora aureofaciens TaxID=1894 RepID=UPI001C458DD4|nr:helix-turn-helix transcriptional regulator [Kitasatospora aureofaciens]MBV6702767.1 helix-turn-helix domain-containing protein [Kitasatospora aureofaciens]
MAVRDRSRAEVGVVSGYLLRLVRESIPRTQVRLAEDVGVDLGTVQGWESGRRPLANTRAADLLQLRRRVVLLGADTELLSLLDCAMDADRILTAVLRPPSDPSDHPLAGWVQSRETAHLIAWAVRGITPPAVSGRAAGPRRGPTPTGPQLGAADRAAFFAHLRQVAESAETAGERALLLRRQALYLASYDPAPDAGDWAEQALRTMRPALALRGYTPRWIEARTAATVAARQGDPEPLRDFVATALADDQHGELANLAYWAYWLGAMPTDQPDDGFMHAPTPAQWNPLALFRGLVGSLHDAPGTVDLYVHSVTTLIDLHPWLPLADPESARAFDLRATQLLDGRLVSAASRHDLESVHYRLQKTN